MARGVGRDPADFGGNVDATDPGMDPTGFADPAALGGYADPTAGFADFGVEAPAGYADPGLADFGLADPSLGPAPGAPELGAFSADAMAALSVAGMTELAGTGKPAAPSQEEIDKAMREVMELDALEEVDRWPGLEWYSPSTEPSEHIPDLDPNRDVG